jgi:digeranylgeranylglycerophospholipid reductase
MTGVEATGMSFYSNGKRRVAFRNVEGCFEAETSLVIAADGVESRVGRWAGLKTHTNPTHMGSCFQFLLENIKIDTTNFDMYISEKYAPGGYAWMFPKSENSANVGLGISGLYGHHKTAEQYLSDFVETFFPGSKIVSSTRGGIPCSGGIKKIIDDGLIICGDAAHMLNPITGGGIVNALRSGNVAGNTAIDAINKGCTEERFLIPYLETCKKRIVKNNRNLFVLQRTLYGFTEAELDKIAGKVLRIPERKRTAKMILVIALLRFPRLIPSLLKAAI